jgi:hypothetical protein
MTEFFKMDFFFVVATIGFIVLAILVGVVLWYVIQILRTMNRVADSVEEEAIALKADLDAARASVRRQGKGLVSSISLLTGFAEKTGKRLLKKRRSS